MSGRTELRYVLLSPYTKINLNLHEAETYEAAIVVQPLVGNLVYYSNLGRYEPRLAKSWRRIEPKIWEFELHDGLVCENGEPITAESFKRSLERSIRFQAKDGGVPVLGQLVGLEAFLSGSEPGISGIEAIGPRLRLTFQKPARSGVIQVLSFAPFGYICSENLNSDGTWKNRERFISSGPYRVESIEIGSRYVLVRRSDWKPSFGLHAPEKVEITHTMPREIDEGPAWIVDRVRNPETLPSGLEVYPLVPEYYFGIFFGNLEKGYFAKIENRRYVKSIIENGRDEYLPESDNGWIRSHSMYPNLEPHEATSTFRQALATPPKHELVIEGSEPKQGTVKGMIWPAIKSAFEGAGIPYRFANNVSTSSTMRDQSFDIRIGSSSIGGGIEGWALATRFCSKIGLRMPDPSGKICELAEAYEKDEVSDDELTQRFLRQVKEDSAIVTLGHYGVRLFLSRNINKASLSPTLSIVRFDQLEVQ